MGWRSDDYEPRFGRGDAVGAALVGGALVVALLGMALHAGGRQVARPVAAAASARR